jgi:hypothetical protein
MAAACATLNENLAASCTQTSRDAKAGETVKELRRAVTKESKPVIQEASKTPLSNALVKAPKVVATASKLGSNNKNEEFWANQSRFGDY